MLKFVVEGNVSYYEDGLYEIWDENSESTIITLPIGFIDKRVRVTVEEIENNVW